MTSQQQLVDVISFGKTQQLLPDKPVVAGAEAAAEVVGWKLGVDGVVVVVVAAAAAVAVVVAAVAVVAAAVVVVASADAVAAAG